MPSKPVKKRINFYQIQATKTIENKKEELSKDEIIKHLQSICSGLNVNSNNYKYQSFEMGFNDYIIEFIKFDDSMLFARIGKKTNENTIGKRDTLSGDLLNIELQDSENIETYTYIYIDLTNMILSYLVLSGTPSRTSFSYFLNENDENIVFDCVPITTKDVIKNLAKKNVLGTIKYSYCNPKECVIENIPGINKQLLSSLNADKSVITVSLRPPRSKSITNKIQDIFNLKDELLKEHGQNLQSLTMNAKDYDEETINYNLLDYKFARYTYISMLSLKTEHDFFDIITQEYKKIKNTLEDFIQ